MYSRLVWRRQFATLSVIVLLADLLIEEMEVGKNTPVGAAANKEGVTMIHKDNTKEISVKQVYYYLIQH